MFKLLLALLTLTSADLAFGKDCAAHPLYCTILDLQPRATPAWAMQLSNSVARHAARQGVDPYLLLAIGMQESSLRDVNRLRGDQITDVGVFQLHVDTITAHGYDRARLLEDLDYQAYAAASLLRQKIDLCATRPGLAFGCYHSVTPALRYQYQVNVLRWYRGPQQLAQEFGQ